MNRYAVIYRPHQARSRGMIAEAERWEDLNAVSLGFAISEVMIEQIVDFVEQRVIPVAVDGNGKLFEIQNHTYGELTSNELLSSKYRLEHPNIMDQVKDTNLAV